MWKKGKTKFIAKEYENDEQHKKKIRNQRAHAYLFVIIFLFCLHHHLFERINIWWRKIFRNSFKMSPVSATQFKCEIYTQKNTGAIKLNELLVQVIFMTALLRLCVKLSNNSPILDDLCFRFLRSFSTKIVWRVESYCIQCAHYTNSPMRD